MILKYTVITKKLKLELAETEVLRLWNRYFIHLVKLKNIKKITFIV